MIGYARATIAIGMAVIGVFLADGSLRAQMPAPEQRFTEIPADIQLLVPIPDDLDVPFISNEPRPWVVWPTPDRIAGMPAIVDRHSRTPFVMSPQEAIDQAALWTSMALPGAWRPALGGDFERRCIAV